MAAPTTTHERRRATLEAVALLTGHVTPATLPGLLPDVLLARGATLFLGEAKATETPGTAATRERLSRYVRHLRRRRQRDVLALCVGDDAGGWAEALNTITSNVSGDSWCIEVHDLGSDEFLVTATKPPVHPWRTALST